MLSQFKEPPTADGVSSRESTGKGQRRDPLAGGAAGSILARPGRVPSGVWKRRRRPAAVFGDAAVIFGRTERVVLRERHVVRAEPGTGNAKARRHLMNVGLGG